MYIIFHWEVIVPVVAGYSMVVLFAVVGKRVRLAIEDKQRKIDLILHWVKYRMDNHDSKPTVRSAIIYYESESPEFFVGISPADKALIEQEILQATA